MSVAGWTSDSVALRPVSQLDDHSLAKPYVFFYVARQAEDKAVFTRNLVEVQGVAAGLIAGIEGGRVEWLEKVGLSPYVRRCTVLWVGTAPKSVARQAPNPLLN